MINPPIGKLMEQADSRYTLVIETAKRARQLAEGAESMISTDSEKFVAVAANEIAQGCVAYINSAGIIKSS